jgi:GAF domain-containing protein
MRLSIFNIHRSPEAKSSRAAIDNPRHTGQPSVLPAAPPQLRDETLQWLMTATALISSLVYLLGLKEMLQQGQIAELVGFGLAIFCLYALTLAKRVRFSIRAIAFFVLSMGLGTAAMANKWLAGDGRLTLLVIPLLAMFLFAEGCYSRWVRAISVVLCLSIIALAALQAYLQTQSTGFALASWLSSGVAFGMITLVVAFILDRYLHRMAESLSESLDRLEGFELERDRAVRQAEKSSHDLDRRLNQIRTVAEINSVTSRLLDLDTLLPQVCNLVKERFGFYYVGVFLVDANQEQAVLKAGTGEAGRKMLAASHRLKVGGDSMVGWATANRKARIALDIDEQGSNPNVTRFNNPHLPNTRSELALPIFTRQAMLGAMTIQSEQEAAFDQDDIIVLQSVADGLASAIENARLFAEQQANLDEISTLHRQYLHHSWLQALETGSCREYEYSSQSARAAETEEGSQASEQTMEIPIQLRGQQLGSMMLETTPGRVFSQDEQSLIQAVINQTALALENARLLDETRQRADQETISANISSKIWSTTNIDAILSTALQELSRSLGVEEGSIELWPENQPVEMVQAAVSSGTWPGAN